VAESTPGLSAWRTSSARSASAGCWRATAALREPGWRGGARRPAAL